MIANCATQPSICLSALTSSSSPSPSVTTRYRCVDRTMPEYDASAGPTMVNIAQGQPTRSFSLGGSGSLLSSAAVDGDYRADERFFTLQNSSK
jgi:hypothetical protein